MTTVQLHTNLPEREAELSRDLIAAMLRASDPHRATLVHLRSLAPNIPTHILAVLASASVAAGHS